MALALVQVAYLVLVPALAILIERRVRGASWLSPVVVCYGAGVLLPVVLRFPVRPELSQHTAEAAVLLSIPLLLFATDVPRWLRLARPTVVSFSLAILSVMFVSGAAALFFRGRVPESEKIAGMLVGVYVGGTANMNAIGLALGVPSEIFVMLNAVDFVLGASYFLFLVVGTRPFLSRLFRPFVPLGDAAAEPMRNPETDRVGGSLARRAAGSAGALLLSIAIAAASAGLSLLLLGRIAAGVVILSATTLGIAGSFVPRLRRLEPAYPTGHYILLVFCVAIGSLTTPRQLAAAGGTLFVYTIVVMYGSIIVHFALARLFGIDRDTAVITSTAAIFGPAFIGPIADVLDNREVVVSGLSTSLVGIALGNYLGIALAKLLA